MLNRFREIWCVDFEYRAENGNLPEIRCLVAKEYKSARTLRLWRDEMGTVPPFPVDEDVLYGSYLATAELSCHLVLDWALPEWVLDLYAEFRCLTNRHKFKQPSGLLDACLFFGIQAGSVADKETNRQLAMQNKPSPAFTANERRKLLNYCEADVDALMALLPKILPHYSSRAEENQALWRGRYMRALSTLEHRGIPVDQENFQTIQAGWESIKQALLDRHPKFAPLFSPTHTLLPDPFAKWLDSRGILEVWPKTPRGKASTSKEAFSDFKHLHEDLPTLAALKAGLGSLRLNGYSVGLDGRNRCLLSPFASQSGRNQPSNKQFIFGGPRWIRRLIKPAKGMAVAYLDYSQQEFAIAAVLSGDHNMMDAYWSPLEDPYMSFAIQASAAPKDATKATHGDVRALYKQAVLGIQYGMTEVGLAKRLQVPVCKAKALIDDHRRVFNEYWAWRDAVLNQVALHGEIVTSMGWHLKAKCSDFEQRSIANFPMQANGADMLRNAIIYAVEAGVSVIAPVHDALMIEAPVSDIEDACVQTIAAMQRASADVLKGKEIRVDCEIVRYPHRFGTDSHPGLWSDIDALLGTDVLTTE